MSELVSGQRLGSYQLVQLIGQTGMSEVWRAHDRDGRLVALKTSSSQAGDDPQLRARFLREGGEHQLMKHPCIVPILDFFEQAGNFYLVMQYIAGGSLEDRLEKLGWKPLPIPEALNISRQILSALDYAHQKGVIHRDVKPSNILLDGDHAYLGDFGIALALGRPRLTTYEQVIGTRYYMSPEQIQTPLKITHLSDVYSFGCVLYEMLTGRQPYPQSDDSKEAQYTMIAKRLHEPPVSPRQYNPAIAVRLERVVLSSLAANPQDRFAGCGSFARALEGLETEKPGPPLAPPKPDPRPVPPVPAEPEVTSRPVKSVSIAGNVIVAILAGLLWVPFTFEDSGSRDVQAMIMVCVVLSNIVLLRILYKTWGALPASQARTTPGRAVGFMFVPFYNLYWVWNAYVGFAKDFNRYVKQVDPQEQPQPDGFYIAFCIFHFYLEILFAFVPQFLTWILDILILTPVMIGIMANAVNRLAKVAAKQPVGARQLS